MQRGFASNTKCQNNCKEIQSEKSVKPYAKSRSAVIYSGVGGGSV